MTKFRKPNPEAAYEIAVGVTAEEAAKLGLAVVENDALGRPAAYGRYTDAPDGGPLGITVAAAPADSEVIAGGDVSAPANAPGTGPKGSLVNPNDPFVHGGTGDESVHADGAEPPVEDLAAEEREQAKIAQDSVEKASKSSKSK